MNKIVAGLGMIGGAMLLSKAKGHMVENYPDQWEKMDSKMSSIKGSLEPYSKINLQTPFSIIEALLHQPAMKGVEDGPKSISPASRYVLSNFPVKSILLVDGGIKAKLARHNFDDHIPKRSFKQHKIPCPDSNAILFEGSGDFDGLWFLTSRFRSEAKDAIDGWYYWLEHVYWNKSYQEKYLEMSLEVARLILWPKEGLLVDAKLERAIRKESGVESYSWYGSPQPHSPKEFEGTSYLSFKAAWTNHIRACKPYNVMLYGKPGCGKTSLLHSWFYEENLRVFRISASDLADAGSEICLLSGCAPDVILVEDLDRIDEQAVASLLSVFEHSVEQKFRYDHFPHLFQPMMIATCNHPTRIADAIWRPGRMDQLVEVSMPDEAEFKQIVKNMADKMGLDGSIILEKHSTLLKEIQQTQTVSHAEQLLQRIKHFGIDYEVANHDQTFTPPVKWDGN